VQNKFDYLRYGSLICMALEINLCKHIKLGRVVSLVTRTIYVDSSDSYNIKALTSDQFDKIEPIQNEFCLPLYES